MTEILKHIAAPEENPETAPFWAAARKGQLLVGKCNACSEAHFYPRKLCPHCFSDDTEWVPSSGKGIIYSYSVMRRAEHPYAIAFVTLAEGVSLMTNIVECDLDSLAIGQKVSLVFVPTPADGAPLPMFKPDN
jgi:uncharacterized protein